MFYKSPINKNIHYIPAQNIYKYVISILPLIDGIGSWLVCVFPWTVYQLMELNCWKKLQVILFGVRNSTEERVSFNCYMYLCNMACSVGLLCRYRIQKLYFMHLFPAKLI